MILPTKRIDPNYSLLAIGARVLSLLDSPSTMSNIWELLASQVSADDSKALLSFEWFVLALDLMFLLGKLEYSGGWLQRVQND
jgi:hypothetical protein